MSKNFGAIVVVIFIVFSAGFYMLSQSKPEFSFTDLMGGNIFMALLSLVTYYFLKKQMAGNPAAFVRGVSAASFLKLLLCAVAIIAYALFNKSHLHKPTLFSLLGIYAVYAIVETIFLSRLSREKN